MKRFLALPLVLLIALAGCSKPKPVVVLNSWWNIGVAKKACQYAKDWMQGNEALVKQRGCDLVKSCPEVTKRYQICMADASGGLIAFESQLAARFAADPACSNVQFEQLTDPNVQRAAGEDASQRWQLMIDYAPGAAEQAWSLEGPASQFMRRSGTPDQIAKETCSLFAGQGTN